MALLEGRIHTIDEYLHRVATVNGASQSNGALMRVTALVHWAAGATDVTPSLVALIARVDAQLSHPNSVCQDCNAIYAYAATLLERRVPPSEAFRQTSEYVMQNIADQTVLKWFFNDSQDITALNCRENIGHVRWGFTLAFHFLQNPHISFEEALRQTLLKGGSAAIVGGLVGCYQPIPEYMRKPVMTLRAEGRPEWLWPWIYFN
jgi:ADP-ribosyl-[dinitrogen reductase] hydrolase